MRDRRGFTLLEILVVVSILAVLLLLLFPAFRFAKIQAARARCLTNIRQITLALKEYAALNANKLPPGYGDSAPFGAKNPNSSSKYLNSYLSGDGYRALECPADESGTPGAEYTYFDTKGFSYYYCGTGSPGQGISNICGSVSWQEGRVGEMPKLDIEDVRRTLGYYGAGPEDQPDPNQRGRDITRDEIDNVAWPAIKSALESLQGREGFNINSDAFRWWKSISSSDHDPDPPPPAPQNPRFKWRDQYSAGDGMPIAIGSRSSDKWDRPSPWSRDIYNYDYWKMSSKKVAVLCWDAVIGFNTPGTNGSSSRDRYPTRGMGFWHQYTYVPDPANPTDKAKYRVRSHAGFLDGHADVIEMNKHKTDSNGKCKCGVSPVHDGTINRDLHDYY